MKCTINSNEVHLLYHCKQISANALVLSHFNSDITLASLTGYFVKRCNLQRFESINCSIKLHMITYLSKQQMYVAVMFTSISCELYSTVNCSVVHLSGFLTMICNIKIARRMFILDVLCCRRWLFTAN